MVKQLFYAPVKSAMGDDNKYSRTIKVPQYEPSHVKPNLWELIDKTKYNELARNIAKADIPDDVKEFLMYGATRHIVFNYGKIADYYAHTTPEIQRLMEQSALVIIDIDDAIANGYVVLSEKMKVLIDEQKAREAKT